MAAKEIKSGEIAKFKDWVEKRNETIDFDLYYSDIEHAIISWSLDGTKTAGTLTRKIIKILKSKKK